MASKRLSVRPRESALAQKSESVVEREALETYLAAAPDEVSAYNIALQAGVIGCAKSGPRDLSTNRKHFKGFGQKR